MAGADSRTLAGQRLKFVTPHVTVGIVITPSKYYVDSGIPCLRSLNVRPDQLIEDDMVFISPESNELLRKSQLSAGDVVIVRTGKPGTAAVVDDRFDCANCIDLIIVRWQHSLDSRFICYVLNSELARTQYEAGTSGAIQCISISRRRAICLCLCLLLMSKSISASEWNSSRLES